VFWTDIKREIICNLFKIHDYFPVKFKEWVWTKQNFRCTLCGKTIKTLMGCVTEK